MARTLALRWRLFLILYFVCTTFTLLQVMWSTAERHIGSMSSNLSANGRTSQSGGLRSYFFRVKDDSNHSTNLKTQMLEQENNGPFSRSTSQICPEYDIPGLVGKMKLDLKDSPMVHTEELIFGPTAGKVMTAAKRANENLRKKLVDPITGNITHVDWLFIQVIESEAINLDNYWYLPGGHWKPVNCLPRWKVAILIPFRDRFHHLPVIIRYLIPMLQRQLLEFSIFVIEQANQELFNRAMLMNVGFLESLKFIDYDCFVIHDVDHVPIDDRNYYGCSTMPRHFLSGADRWNYTLPYDTFFGAVSGFTKGNILSINGFPNVYWGWGGEDDEIWMRVKEVGLNITRHGGPVTYYDVIKHHHKSAPPAKERDDLLNTFKGRYKSDGLSNIAYSTPVYDLHNLYTNISVDIRKIKPRSKLSMPNNGSRDELAKNVFPGPTKKEDPGVHKPGEAPAEVKIDLSPKVEKDEGDGKTEEKDIQGRREIGR